MSPFALLQSTLGFQYDMLPVGYKHMEEGNNKKNN